MHRHTFARWSLCSACLLFFVLSFPLPASAAGSQGDVVHHGLSQDVNTQPERQSWHIVLSPNVGMVSSQLNNISAIDASNIWSVGYYYTDDYSTRTLIEHWNGSQWSVVSSPNVVPYLNQLAGVAAVSSSDVWAVGYDETHVKAPFKTLIEHWDGSQWSVVPSPDAGSSDNLLEAIAAISSNNVWAVGTYYSPDLNANLTLIEHWNGSQWSVVSSPNTKESINELLSVAAISANNIWAVGDGQNPGYITLVEHWDGSQWSIVKSPNAPNSNSGLQGISVIAPNNIWAAGFYYDLNHDRDATLIEHWNGTTWSIVKSPNIGADFDRLLAITAISATSIYAVGDNYNGTATLSFIEHWNGIQWAIVQSPSPGSGFNSLDAALAISGKVWATGYYFNNQANYYETLVELHG